MHPRRFSRKRSLAAALVVLATSVTAFVACTTSTSTTVPPTTGILIRAETLNSDRGCGPGPTRLFKYAVVLYRIKEDLVGTPAEGDPTSYSVAYTGNVFDCFADGTFVKLDATKGNATYRLEVFAYNDTAYNAAGAEIQRGALDHDGTLLRNTSPTWTTVCMATQQENVQALANCAPLSAGLSGLAGGTVEKTLITLPTQTFTVNGRIANCVPESDAGADAATDDGGDGDAGANDGGDADAAAPPAEPLSFSRVRIRPRVGATVAGPVEVVMCPTPYLAEVLPNPASYQLDVELLDSAETLVSADAQTVCTVTSQPGQTSSAVCQ